MKADRIGEPGLQALLAGFCALPLALVTLVLSLGISPAEASSLYFPSVHPLPLAAFAFISVSGAFFLVIRIREPLVFALALSISLLAILGATVWAGTFLHRDYFSAVFMDLPAALCLIMAWVRSRPPGSLRPEALKALGGAGCAVFAVFALWILMMGYAISTRAEPRPIESIIYNSYNAVLAFLLLLLSRGVVLRSRRTLVLSSAGVFLDGAPVEEVLGATEIAILRAFVEAREGGLACAGIQKLLDGSKPDRKRRYECAACDPEASKAALCPGYRGIYNRVLVIKRLLEFLEVGTILPPRNKLKILSAGWRLLLFENVRVRSEE